MFEMTVLFTLFAAGLALVAVFALGALVLKVALKVLFFPVALVGMVVGGLVLLVVLPLVAAVVLPVLAVCAVVAIPLAVLGLVAWAGIHLFGAVL